MSISPTTLPYQKTNRYAVVDMKNCSYPFPCSHFHSSEWALSKP
ncbi:hypothetical protein HMPREF1991_02855 [Hoylesella loescheii DSM 19665 = JCM 12249 = ATCC 15930]|uniref:Uncharacterized protein n=1 Tax=Hoylesella loescheii DSM 19665 = JCM 12249 = ATCC 15930 TaxID=1122985 RepID=A0A069QEI7_HOYLO|nr:hypothetical protein HMPREF1991_02855 [Hoylesella loescheii DSM 19665 = JCM 12249 = ATCC 15930]